MSRIVTVADDVAAQLGAEQVARLRGPEWARRVQCWQCHDWIEADQDTTVLLLRIPELEDPTTGATTSFALHAHPDCLSSQVLVLTAEQVRAHRASAVGDEPDEDPDTVDVVATVFDTGRADQFYPVVLLSHRIDLVADEPGPDRVDLLTTGLLSHGWHQITTLTGPPAPGPAGYRVRFTHDQAHAGAPGVLELLDPSGLPETVAQIEPTRLWRPAVVRSGSTALFQGSHYLTDWATRGRAGVKRAIRAGLLVGGVVPVELSGPGNNVTGSVFR
jgi:hypothetical protein